MAFFIDKSSRKYPQPPSKFPASEALLRRTCELWTNFAKFGNPTPPSSDFPQWNPVQKIGQKENFKLDYFEMDNDQLMNGVNPDHERMEFWRKVYNEFNNGLLKAKL